MAQERASDPIRTARRSFTVPFEVDETLPPHERPAAVELHVSTDGGATWRMHEQASPDQGGFKFDAPHDGEFWFAIRTIDRGMPPVRLVDIEPELRVIVESEPRAGSAPPLALADLPHGAPVRMVNTRTFDVDYDVANLARSEIEAIELWRTADSGRTWQLHDRDVDRRSPMRVAVNDAGLYGFSLVVVASNGLAGVRPENGQPPQFWVGVDQTRPIARLTTAETHPAAPGQTELTVRWEATDERLAAQPIALLYGPAPNGPWQPLVEAAPNAGYHTCPIPVDMPREAYLRLVARDEAGNVQVCSAKEPIVMPLVSGRRLVAGLSARLYHVFR
jgi:hypothetical protein